MFSKLKTLLNVIKFAKSAEPGIKNWILANKTPISVALGAVTYYVESGNCPGLPQYCPIIGKVLVGVTGYLAGAGVMKSDSFFRVK